MRSRTIGILLVSLLVGAIVGFFAANSMKRSEIAALSARTGPRIEPPANTQEQSPTLSPEELAATIKRADDNPRNPDIQRQIGVALYRYAAMKEDADLLKSAITILAR